MEQNAVIIFAKNPMLGRAKTRIAKDVGDEKALEIYNNLLALTENILKGFPVQKYLFFTEFIDDKLWTIDKLSYRLQGSGNLGERMSDAFINVFHSGHKKTIIMGSDCPYITKNILADAFKELDEFDHVIGPAVDGGFYLYGTKKFHTFLFDGVQWSTDSVLESTLENIVNMGESCKLLPTLTDIDHISDWEDFISSKN